MALEPMTVSADEEADPELDDMSRRFWICLVLTTPLLLLSMAEMVPGLSFPAFSRAGPWYGFNSPWRPRSSCGAACRFSSGAGRRSLTVI